jgi:long-chain acyl-CoA synthetase
MPLSTAATPSKTPPQAPGEHLLRPILTHAEQQPDLPLFAYRENDRFVELSAAQVAETIRQLARGLIASGVSPGDRVVIMSPTRVEWALLDHAILMAGAVTVPIFDTSSAEQIRWIIDDSGAVLAFVDTVETAVRFAVAADDMTHLRETLVIDEDAIGLLADRSHFVPPTEVDDRLEELGPETLATIIYTSGTTGRAKGCALTHGNLRGNVLQCREIIGSLYVPGDSILLFLPLAHSFAKILLLIAIELGMKVSFSDLQKVIDDLPAARPTWIASVPRVFEKVYNGAQRKAATTGKGAIFARAASTAIAYSEARHGGRASLASRLSHTLFDRLVYGKLRAALGGELRYAFSGGAPLGARLTHFFNGVGIQIFEGYGLTETSPVLTMNAPHAWRIGSVGQPVPHTQIRLGEDREILVKGVQVFAGYWRNEEATREAIDSDGWLHTGDLGRMDADGYLHITGRKKEILVTASGKNVAPAPLEDRLRAHPLISQALIVGEGRPFIAALITLDEEAFADWAERHKMPGAPLAENVDHPDLVAEIQRAVDEVNLAVSRAESVRSFVILPHDFTIEDNELTPTLKVRRSVVTDREQTIIDGLYADRPSTRRP